MRLHNLDNTSIKYYLSEDLKRDPALNEQWDRIDNEFFKPWQRYLNEATLTPDQINQMFAAAEKETSAGGGNSSMLGKIVDKIIPDAFLGKLEKALPEPDPKAVPDPEFEAKATAAVSGLEAPAETKTGLMAIVKAAVKNPQAQAVVLSLVGGVLGGLMSKAGPLIATFFPGGGTAAVAITGAIVAGGVAIAAAKLQGKPWKEAFKGAIKPALAGAAGAVIGQFAAGIAGAAVDKVAGALSSNKPADAGAPPGGAQGSPEQQQAMADDQAFQDRMLNKFPPDKGYTFSAKGDSLQVFDANGTKVFNGDIPLKTMSMKAFADLTNNGQMTNSGTTSGSVAGDPMAGVTDAGGGSKRGNSGFNSMKQTNPDGTPYSVDQINQAKADLRAGGNLGNYPDGTPKMPGDDYYTQSLAGDFSKVPNTPNDGSTRVIGKQGGVPAGATATDDAGSYFLNKTNPDGSSSQTIRSNADPADPRVRAEIDARQAYYKNDPQGQAEIKRIMGSGRKGIDDGRIPTGKKLSEGQVYLVFNRIVTRNDYLLVEGRLAEGPMDWLKTKAKNLTTKVTADKLNSAWQKAGSPTDSEQLKKFLTDQGVATEVVDKVYTDMKLPAAGAAADAGKPVDTAELEKQINTFDTKQKQDILAYLTQSLRTA